MFWIWLALVGCAGGAGTGWNVRDTAPLWKPRTASAARAATTSRAVSERRLRGVGLGGMRDTFRGTTVATCTLQGDTLPRGCAQITTQKAKNSIRSARTEHHGGARRDQHLPVGALDVLPLQQGYVVRGDVARPGGVGQVDQHRAGPAHGAQPAVLPGDRDPVEPGVAQVGAVAAPPDQGGVPPQQPGVRLAPGVGPVEPGPPRGGGGPR